MRLGLGNRTCCCETPCQTVCPGPPTVPAEYQIEVDGITGGGAFMCMDCSPLNGTFVLSYDPNSPNTNGCTWRSPDIAMCGFDDVRWEYSIYCRNCFEATGINFQCRNVLSVWRIDTTSIGDASKPYGIIYSGYGDVLLPDSGNHQLFCGGWPSEIQVVRL